MIRLENSDWLYNAGIVGLVNILEFNGDTVEKHKHYVEFDPKLLKNFEEKYFNYLSSKYEKFTSFNKIVSFEEDITKYKAKIKEKNAENIFNEQDLEKINKYIEYTKTKLKSNSYKSAYLLTDDKSLDILSEEKSLKKISKTKKETLEDIEPTIIEQLDLIKNITDYLKKENVSKYVLAKNIMYDVVDSFWSGVSFLHTSASNSDMYKEYKTYFIDSTVEYMLKDKSKYKYSCITCRSPISKFSKPESFDLVWLNKMGVDPNRKSSHFWNLNCDAYICPTCNLVYSCVPAGFTTLYKKGFFINENSDLKRLISVNKHSLTKNMTLQELEDKSYYTILDSIGLSEVSRIEKEVQNIQVVKIDATNTQRPYTFNVLAKDKVKILVENRGRLKYLINANVYYDELKDYKNLYKEVFDRLYKNQNQFDLIQELLKLALQDKYRDYEKIDAIIKINNNFLGGRMENKVITDGKIFRFRELGNDLKKTYEGIGAKNKVSTISNGLYGALRAKNEKRFMDTIINSYMYLNKPTPVDFIDFLKDTDTFQTLGYSFLLGVTGEKYTKKTNEEEI